jgi:hypothetical protein
MFWAQRAEVWTKSKVTVMERWTPAEVAAAATAVDDAWPLPTDMEAVQTDDCLVLCRPVHLSSPTSGRVQVWINSLRPFSEIRPEVEQLAREWGADEVSWWVEGEVGQAVDEALRFAGAHLTVIQLVMARPLGGVDADAWLAGGYPPGVGAEVVADETAFQALTGVETAGWGRVAPSPGVLVEEWERLRADLVSSSAFALLATTDGTPAAVGRCRLFASVVRLFGAVTLPEFRRRGLYSSVVAARCRLGRVHGATLALTKARPATSAPILKQAGFRSYWTERCWRLHVDGS